MNKQEARIFALKWTVEGMDIRQPYMLYAASREANFTPSTGYDNTISAFAALRSSLVERAERLRQQVDREALRKQRLADAYARQRVT